MWYFKISLCFFQLTASSACSLLFLYLLVLMLLFVLKLLKGMSLELPWGNNLLGIHGSYRPYGFSGEYHCALMLIYSFFRKCFESPFGGSKKNKNDSCVEIVPAASWNRLTKPRRFCFCFAFLFFFFIFHKWQFDSGIQDCQQAVR